MKGAIINKPCIQRGTIPSNLKQTNKQTKTQLVSEEMADSRSWAVIVQDNPRISSYTRK